MVDTHCTIFFLQNPQTYIQSLKKQMTKLAIHSVASRVVELLFATFPSKFTSPLKLELYGPQYALFANTITTTVVDNKSMNNAAAAAAMAQQLLPTLEVFVQNHPDKRAPTLVHIRTMPLLRPAARLPTRAVTTMTTV